MPTDLPVVELGTSAARTLRKCEQKFVYADVRQLEPISAPLPQKLGSWFHVLIAAHYLGRMDPKRPHWTATYALMNDQWRGQRDAMRSLGVEVPPDGLDELPDKALRLMDAYVYHYGTLAASRGWDDFDVVSIEEPYTYDVRVADRLIVRARATTDAVIRDRRGRLWVLETKTGQSFPYDRTMRLLEPQVTLQMLAAERTIGEPVAGAIYNWIRTIPPVADKMINKNGSIAARGYTDYLTFRKALNARGLDPEAEPYRSKLRELADPTTSRFFKRVIVHRTKHVGRVALANHARLALRAERLRRKPHVADRVSDDRECGMCVFRDLCAAELLGDRQEIAAVLDRYRPRTDERTLLRLEAELEDDG